MTRAETSVIAGCVIVGVAVSAAVWLGGAGSPEPAAAAPRVDAHEVFLSDCAVCHGADGHGTSKGPSLVGVGARRPTTSSPPAACP